ncbi:MAG: hypothetical protein U9R40_04825 [Synergistota bacterium]|nr:hypothetical protein [Synergistota bacterium]
MKKKKHLKGTFAVLLGVVLCIGVVAGRSSGVTTITDMARWPVWPDYATVSNSPIAPLSFTSIGRDVMAWVQFTAPSASGGVWGGEISALYRTDQGDYEEASVIHTYVNQNQDVGYMVESSPEQFKDNTGILNQVASNMQTCSALPSYVAEWYSVDGVTCYPNQAFGIYSNAWISAWFNFLTGSTLKAGEVLADSGHAPPLVVWKSNPWLAVFVDENSPPEAWGDNPYLFIPTNDGMTQMYEVRTDVSPSQLEREWSMTPLPAFRAAVFQEWWKRLNGSYLRITNLDGPLAVHDIENSSGEWKRVMLGATGMGSDLVSKPATAWLAEGYPDIETLPQSATGGRFRGLYAFDITSPESPRQLWSWSLASWVRDSQSQESLYMWDPASVMSGEGQGYDAMSIVNARPVIGFTTDEEDQRVWSALLVCIDTSGYFRWYNLDPATGEIRGTGVFADQDGAVETPEYYDGTMLIEDLAPSRVLSAFPKEGSLPVLSDVYVWLSNGSCYKWNLQGGEAPVKLFRTIASKNHAPNGSPPIQDFDVAYITDQDGTLHTYIAGVVALDFPQGNPHDTTSMFVVDLEDALGDYSIETYDPVIFDLQQALGQDGDTAFVVKHATLDESFFVQLQDGSGANADEFDRLVASPLFINNTLYLAVYSSEANLSRLYTLNMDDFNTADVSSKVAFVEGEDYLDFSGEEFLAATVDSEGFLSIPKADGTVERIDLNISFTGSGTGGGGTESDDVMQTVFWRVRRSE